MKKLLSIALLLFITVSVSAQKTSKWIDKKAKVVSQDMKKVLSLSDEQTTAMYDIEVEKLVAIYEAKKKNGGKNISNDAHKALIAPFVAKQTEVAGGRKKMNAYYVYMKEKRAKK
ncbi:hypothetical protein [Flavicella sediminum]|uniref:hypothetical protein n=1 Tax=Flavicella sediminum TaxID=2585141 RepID=UPI0011243891|nr:hypothetical protein [Flavicella sediminum]